MCSGSLDYLQGGPFAFVPGLDAVGAWPPIRESHVEMDAAWALYEAWVAIQTGEVDSALVYGFGKSSPGDLHEIMTLQIDPYYVAAAVAVDGRHGRAAGARVPRRERSRPSRTSPRSRPASQRNAQANPHAVRKGDVDAPTTCSQQPVTHDPLRDADIAPITDGAAAVVIAAGDLARSVCERPAWIRGIEHRIEAHSLGVRDLDDVGVDARRGASAAGVADGNDRRRRAARAVQPRGADPRRGARARTATPTINPSGGALAVEPGDERRA